MPDFKVLTAGDTALVVEFGETVDRKLSTFVLALARGLDDLRLDGIVETVPTFRSLMVHYDPLVIPAAALVARIEGLMAGLPIAEFVSREWRLPVCYDAELAPDLADVAARTGLTPAQVIERHSAVAYHVYMLGFLPGLAYMGDVPAELALSRRETPRQRIPAGSVAIATSMSIIFPRESPTGWHVIGRSPVPLWRRPPASTEPAAAPNAGPSAGPGAEPNAALGAGGGALLAPGDKVIFVPVSLHEFGGLSARAAAGALDVVPVNAPRGAAA
jgi:inhibitor of KinA